MESGWRIWRHSETQVGTARQRKWHYCDTCYQSQSHPSQKSPGFPVPRPFLLPWCCGPPSVPHELNFHRGSEAQGCLPLSGWGPPRKLPLPRSAPHDSLGLWRHNVCVWQKRLTFAGVWDFPPCTAPYDCRPCSSIATLPYIGHH